MDERQIGLALTLKELGVSSDVSEFNCRLILQKAVYLIEESGIRLGYSFTWYLRGPYSPALTRDLFDLASNKEDVAGWVLDDKSQSLAKRIGSLFANKPNDDLSAKARRLELLASLHYLSRRRRLDLDDPEEATAQLAQNGKLFSEAEVSNAIHELKRAQLL